MVEIKLTNTRTRSKERFAPIDPQNVRMYLCGPTVYDRAHLGNARPVVVFDVLYRLLRHVYGNDHVTYVRNFTDVDDKINASALARQQSGDPRPLEELIRERTEETIGWYHADMDALGALRPGHEPRATDYIPQMIAMIEALIAKGHAYAAEGHVLFDVRSFPAYGRLSGRSVDDMIAGARVEVAPFKRDPMDFVLWKPSSDEEPGWASPWGRGRPGWHIECSAMSAALLGESFDIHGGGIDLQFPHHENEIAQSCCAHPQEDFARVWLHNEMLQVEGKKMSKSLGNFFTVRDLLDQGIPGEVIRYVFLMTHYRSPMDWTEEKVREATQNLKRWNELTLLPWNAVGQLSADIVNALADDLDTPRVMTLLHDQFRQAWTARNLLVHADRNLPMGNDWLTGDSRVQVIADFLATARFLGFAVRHDDPYLRKKIVLAADLWNRYRLRKKYDVADKIRAQLAQCGVELRATKASDGSPTYGIGHTYIGDMSDDERNRLTSEIRGLLTEFGDGLVSDFDA